MRNPRPGSELDLSNPIISSECKTSTRVSYCRVSHSSEPGLIMKVGVISIIQAWSQPVLNYDSNQGNDYYTCLLSESLPGGS